MGLPGLNSYKAEDKVSRSKTQRRASCEAQSLQDLDLESSTLPLSLNAQYRNCHLKQIVDTKQRTSCDQNSLCSAGFYTKLNVWGSMGLNFDYEGGPIIENGGPIFLNVYIIGFVLLIIKSRYTRLKGND